MTGLSTQAKTIITALCSMIIGGTVVAECSNGGKIRWEPKGTVPVDSVAQQR